MILETRKIESKPSSLVLINYVKTAVLIPFVFHLYSLSFPFRQCFVNETLKEGKKSACVLSNKMCVEILLLLLERS